MEAVVDPIMCECGAPLVDEVTDEGVRPVGAEDIIPFRRGTDYVICANCLKAYGARDLIAQVHDARVIDLLERMATRVEKG